jgi:hypothetical protein
MTETLNHIFLNLKPETRNPKPEILSLNFHHKFYGNLNTLLFVTKDSKSSSSIIIIIVVVVFITSFGQTNRELSRSLN